MRSRMASSASGGYRLASIEVGTTTRAASSSGTDPIIGSRAVAPGASRPVTGIMASWNCTRVGGGRTPPAVSAYGSFAEESLPSTA